ncbi:UNKNOWN [Stylonychia lemnae]|uniref:Uncharacterized protein n=1 Tax=Stylonychia lemnae TaxID=5949 RepID=A0A078BE19_STYLE|nr:UNKNOWN [Stylonychia lemnae]|eukprot:CDW91392.1 UNKNOWN [Stylonychia lemnae]
MAQNQNSNLGLSSYEQNNHNNGNQDRHHHGSGNREYGSGPTSFVFGDNDNFKCDYMDTIKPALWKNIPIPVVESIEKVVMEFDSLNLKLNRQFDGFKRYTKRMQFDQQKMLEQIKIREDQMEQKMNSQISKMRDQIKQDHIKTEHRYNEFSDRVNTIINEIMFTKLPDMDKSLFELNMFVSNKGYMADIKDMVIDINEKFHSFRNIHDDLFELKASSERHHEHIKTNHKDIINAENKIQQLANEAEQIRNDLKNSQFLGIDSLKNVKQQIIQDKVKFDDHIDDVRKLGFKVEVDLKYLEERFTEFVEKDFEKLNYLVRKNNFIPKTPNFTGQIKRIISDEMIELEKKVQKDRDIMKIDFDERFNELINNLQNLVNNNDGGKSLAGMTALGQMLKNLRQTNNSSGYEKLEEKIVNLENLLKQHATSIVRMQKVIQLKQSKNESTFLKQRQKRDSTNPLTIRKIPSKDFNFNEDLEFTGIQHTTSSAIQKQIQDNQQISSSQMTHQVSVSQPNHSRMDEYLYHRSHSHEKKDRDQRLIDKNHSYEFESKLDGNFADTPTTQRKERKMILTKLGSHFVKTTNDFDNDELAIMTVREENENEEQKVENMYSSASLEQQKREKQRKTPSKYKSNNNLKISPITSPNPIMSKFFKASDPLQEYNSENLDQKLEFIAQNIQLNHGSSVNNSRHQVNNKLSALTSSQGFNQVDKISEQNIGYYDLLRMGAVEEVGQEKKASSTSRVNNDSSRLETQNLAEKVGHGIRATQELSDRIKENTIRNRQQHDISRLVTEENLAKRKNLNSSMIINSMDALKQMAIKQQRIEETIIKNFSNTAKNFVHRRRDTQSHISLPKVARTQQVSPDALIFNNGVNVKRNKDTSQKVRERQKALQVQFEMINGLRS